MNAQVLTVSENISRILVPVLSILMTVLVPMMILGITLLWGVNSDLKTVIANQSIMQKTVDRVQNEQQKRSPSIHVHDKNGDVLPLYNNGVKYHE